MRALEVRLAEYSTSLRSTAAQLVAIAEQVEALRPDENPETQGLRDSARLESLIADDLDKILAGEELKGFIVIADLPGAGS